MDNINLHFNDDTQWLVISRAVEKEYRFSHDASWITSQTEPGFPPPPLDILSYAAGWGMSALEWPGCAAIRLARSPLSEITAEIHAVSVEMLAKVESLLKTWFPMRENNESDIVVTFSSYGPHGVRVYRRSLLAPSWSSIRSNYAEGTRESLAALYNMKPCTESGKLLLWSGAPGTGKSYALRGLAHSWKSWCHVHYVLDPEHFFGGHADYLTEVLLGDGGNFPTVRDSPVPEPCWRLIVLEDTGELLSADAKTRSGQGLSRLLNVSDGLIGQGLRILVLITTNEELGGMHKAVIRPGRCVANIRFDLFRQEEARMWLDSHGLDGAVPAEATLSDLYAVLNEKSVIGRRSGQIRSVGF